MLNLYIIIDSLKAHTRMLIFANIRFILTIIFSETSKYVQLH